MASDTGVGDPLMLTYKQACKKLGDVSLSQLYRLMRAGEIKPVELGPRVRRIMLDELEAYGKRLVAERDAKDAAA